MGRRPKLTAHQWGEARADLASGAARQADLARRLNVSESTISRRAAKAEQMPQLRTLDAATDEAAREFLQRIAGQYSVREALVFGSRARGHHRPDSDADLAIVLEGDPGNRWAVTRELSGVAFDVMLDTGILVQPLPLWENEFRRPELFSNPQLIDAIKREGLRL